MKKCTKNLKNYLEIKKSYEHISFFAEQSWFFRLDKISYRKPKPNKFLVLCLPSSEFSASLSCTFANGFLFLPFLCYSSVPRRHPS